MTHNPKDQDGQLQWLADTLLQAEKNGEKVHILGHINSNQCFRTWTREFRRILSRLVNKHDATVMSYRHNMHYTLCNL
jgi:sphingomyelin phosphodiesterase